MQLVGGPPARTILPEIHIPFHAFTITRVSSFEYEKYYAPKCDSYSPLEFKKVATCQWKVPMLHQSSATFFTKRPFSWSHPIVFFVFNTIFWRCPLPSPNPKPQPQRDLSTWRLQGHRQAIGQGPHHQRDATAQGVPRHHHLLLRRRHGDAMGKRAVKSWADLR